MNQSAQIEEAIQELHKREEAYVEACREAADAEAVYRSKKAFAYLEADGTVAERNAQADLACAELLNIKLTAEAKQTLTRAMMDNCRAELSARQSMLSASSKTHYAMDLHSLKQT